MPCAMMENGVAWGQN